MQDKTTQAIKQQRIREVQERQLEQARIATEAEKCFETDLQLVRKKCNEAADNREFECCIFTGPHGIHIGNVERIVGLLQEENLSAYAFYRPSSYESDYGLHPEGWDIKISWKKA